MLKRSILMVLCLSGGALVPANVVLAANDGPAMLTAARELNRQMNMMQDIFGSDPRLLQINGLFQQTTDFLLALEDFRQQVNANASREQIVISFDVVDRKLAAIFAEIRQVEKDDASLRVVCRYMRAAASALHFAVFAADTTPAGQNARLLRQTLSQIAFVGSLADNVAWQFAGRQSAPAWKDDFAKLQTALTTLQGLAQDKATANDISKQFRQVDEIWNAIYQRYQAIPKQEQLLMRSFIALVDQGFGRMATLVGVSDRRAPLADF
jgi:hypothetical protein